MNELDNLSKDAFLQSANRDQNVGKIAIAYTVWSKKKGGGKLIVKEVYKMIRNLVVLVLQYSVLIILERTLESKVPYK